MSLSSASHPWMALLASLMISACRSISFCNAAPASARYSSSVRSGGAVSSALPSPDAGSSPSGAGRTMSVPLALARSSFVKTLAGDPAGAALRARAALSASDSCLAAAWTGIARPSAITHTIMR